MVACVNSLNVVVVVLVAALYPSLWLYHSGLPSSRLMHIGLFQSGAMTHELMSSLALARKYPKR